MQWTKRGAHLLLQMRVKTLNQELGTVFQRWYPDLQPEEDPWRRDPKLFDGLQETDLNPPYSVPQVLVIFLRFRDSDISETLDL
jgi:hypothetical protein